MSQTSLHTPPPRPLNSLSMAGRWARSWHANVFCQSAGRLARLLNDGSPLRPVLHMLAPLRKVGQVLACEQGLLSAVRFLQVSASFHVVDISKLASVAGFLAFSGDD